MQEVLGAEGMRGVCPGRRRYSRRTKGVRGMHGGFRAREAARISSRERRFVLNILRL